MDIDFSKFETEMNRGFFQVLVLVVLEESLYGYMMLKELEKNGYTIEESTLYPLLRRLEKNGLVSSRWILSDSRPRKYYRISERGVLVRKQLLTLWRRQNEVLEKLAKEVVDV